MRPVAIIQARIGSTRLPGKILMPLRGHPMLWHVVQRVRATLSITEVVVATTTEERDEPVRAFCAAAGIACFSGSEQDVLDRFYQAAVRHQADPVVRITADCPLVDPGVIERVLTMYATGKFDHVGVATGAGAAFQEQGRFPDGLDAECFSFAALERAWREATAASDREHVTPFIWRQPGRFRLGVLRPHADYSTLRWTVDTAADFQVAEQIYAALYAEHRVFDMHDVLRYLQLHPELTAANQSSIGKEGYKELWQVESKGQTNPDKSEKGS
jgi:spore coat polysaccharide biosynthesis protein SpsF